MHISENGVVQKNHIIAIFQILSHIAISCNPLIAQQFPMLYLNDPVLKCLHFLRSMKNSQLGGHKCSKNCTCLVRMNSTNVLCLFCLSSA